MARKGHPPRVVAIFPGSRGFGYAVFEGPAEPIDWGTKLVPGDKRGSTLEKIRILFEWYEPDTVVVENVSGEGSRRGKRVEGLIRAVVRHARASGIPVASYSRARIREYFSRFGAKTKDQIASVIARELPVFSPRVPPERKIWMSEHHRMAMFDAIALVLTHFHCTSMRHERE